MDGLEDYEKGIIADLVRKEQKKLQNTKYKVWANRKSRLVKLKIFDSILEKLA